MSQVRPGGERLVLPCPAAPETGENLDVTGASTAGTGNSERWDAASRSGKVPDLETSAVASLAFRKHGRPRD